jgi:hypothetical protein
VPSTVAYYGHHRCGSNWIINVLARLARDVGMDTIVQDHAMTFPAERDLPEPRGARGRLLLCWNADVLYVRELGLRGFHVIRDPRDVVVSGYFSHLHSHPDADWPRLRAYRRYLARLGESDGLMAEMEFSSIYLFHMFSWDYADPNILEMRFEDLIADPSRGFARALGHLGLVPDPVAPERLGRVLDLYSFERITGGRKPGEENVRSHFRKGVPGDWKAHFTERHIRRFKELYNPLLLKTGYETHADW